MPATKRRIPFGWEALLLALAVAGVIVVAVSRGGIGGASPPRASNGGSRDSTGTAPGSATPAPAIRPLTRERIPPPLGADAIAAMGEPCRLRVLELVGRRTADSLGKVVTATDTFGVRSTLSERPDSLVLEGTVADPDEVPWVWHCAVPRTWDPLRPGEVRADAERPWPGLPHRFGATRGFTDAAAKECVDRAFRRFPEYDIRTRRRARHGDTLVVSGEAFPIFDDLVRGYRCTVVVRDGVVAAISLDETR